MEEGPVREFSIRRVPVWKEQMAKLQQDVGARAEVYHR